VVVVMVACSEGPKAGPALKVCVGRGGAGSMGAAL
jgi:hypothetical protein